MVTPKNRFSRRQKIVVIIVVVSLALINAAIITTILPKPAVDDHRYDAHPEAAIHIAADGEVVYPANVNVQHTLERNGNVYTLKGNLSWELIIYRSDIIFDGKGFTVGNEIGASNYQTIGLSNVKNVTVKNVNIVGHYYGMAFIQTQNSIAQNISGGLTISMTNSQNNMVANSSANLLLSSSSNNTAINCTSSSYQFENSNYNSIINNVCSGAGRSIEFSDSSNNLVFGSSFKTIWWLSLYGTSTHNNFVANNVTYYQNYAADSLLGNNTFYHNSFFNFVWNHTSAGNSQNVWDVNGQGNYFSDYKGADLNHDGVGDTPYRIDNTNVDSAPLMVPVDVEKEPFPAF